MTTPPPIQRTPHARKKKTCLTVGLGCAVVLLIVAIVVIVMLVKVMAPGPPLTMQRFVEPGDLGVIHLAKTKGDPGVEAFIKHTIITFQEQANQSSAVELPPAFQWLQQLQSKQRAAQDFRWAALPEAMFVLHELDETGTPAYSAAVNLRSMPTLTSTMVSFLLKQAVQGNSTTSGEVYRGVPYTQNESMLVGYARKVLLLGSTVETVQQSVDRFLDYEESSAWPELLPRPEATTGWDLSAHLLNRDNWFADSILAVFRTGNEDRDADTFGEDVQAAMVLADLAGADHLRMEIRLVCAEAENAEAWAKRMGSVFAAQQELLAQQGFFLDPSTAVEGREAVLRCTIRGLQNWVGARIEEMFEQEPTPLPPDAGANIMDMPIDPAGIPNESE